MRKKLAVMMAAMAATAMVGGCGAKDAAPTGAETKPAETSAAQETEAAQEETKEADAHEAEYLAEFFDVQIKEDPDSAAFSADLKKVAGDEAPAVEGDMTWFSAVKAAVAAADYEELALSYPEDKIKDRLEQYGVKMDETNEYARYVAAALDTSLITSETAKKVVAEDAFTAEDEISLLMAIANANGDARNYLGMSNDPDIYAKLDQAWNSFILFDDSKLAEIGKEAVQNKVTTGYGLKSAAYSARFLPELTLQYGHSDIKHVHQLMGLLNSENITAKVQLEPKISIYQYLPEWGPIPEATPTYEVKEYEDLALVYAVEYDLELEFDNLEDMNRFDEVIKTYAKKNEGNEEAKGLIYASWWQPLYSSTRTDMPETDYHQIYDCVITNDTYSIHPFTLPEDKDEVVEKLTEISDGLEVVPVERFCNTAFYHYLEGEDYQ